VYQNEVNQLKQARAMGLETNNKVWRTMKYFDQKHKLLYMMVFGFCYGTLVLLLHKAHLPGDCLRSSLLAYAICVLVTLACLSYYLVKFSKINDPYFCRMETNIGTTLMLGQIFIIITYPIFPQMYFPWFDYRWISVVVNPVTLLVNGVFPVLLTFDSFRFRLEASLRIKVLSPEEKKEADTARDVFALRQGGGGEIFQAVLENAILLEAFTQFSVTEWSVENILFFQTAKEFRESYDEKSKPTMNLGRRIIGEYIESGAPMEVNVDHDIRKALIAAKDDLKEDSFDAAQRQIYILMKNDTFAKWGKTTDFKAAIERIVKGPEFLSSPSPHQK